MGREPLRLRKVQLDRMMDYANTFGTNEGKRVLDDMEMAFGGPCYTKGDSYDTIYREGQRDVVDRIKEMIKISQSPIEIEEEEEEQNA